MHHLIPVYQEKLNLQNAFFSRIEHDEARVAIVYKITRVHGAPLVLKVCPRAHDYFAEKYFLTHLADSLPVPQIIDLIEPAENVYGAILMEFVSGKLLTKADINNALAYEIGSLLARIHLNRVTEYGNLTMATSLSGDPARYFTIKFQEGIQESSGIVPQSFLDQCQQYYTDHVKLLTNADGPCIVHRDFRPGNIIAYHGKVQGVIDWSSARASFAQEDFCHLEQGTWPDAIKNSFLAGYESIRQVPEYSSLMPLLQLSQTIAQMGFLVKRGTWATTHAREYEANLSYLRKFFKH